MPIAASTSTISLCEQAGAGVFLLAEVFQVTRIIHRSWWTRAAMAVTVTTAVLGFGAIEKASADPAQPDPQAELSIIATSPTSLVAGAPATWSYDITNAGPADAVNVQGTGTMPTRTTLLSVTGASCSVANQTIACGVPMLPANTTVAVAVTILLDPAIPPGTVIQGSGHIHSDTLDPMDSNNYYQVTSPPVMTQADLSWTVTAHPPADGTLDPGDYFDYTIAVTNHGPSNALSVAVVDPLPRALSFVSSTSGCSASGQTVTCPTIASLAPGDSRSFTFTVQLDPAYTGDGSDLGNSTTVTTTTPPSGSAPTPPPTMTPAPPVGPGASAGLKFVPVDPVRVLDTRDGTGGVAAGKVAAGGQVSFPVIGGQVPAEAKAVALNITTTAVDGPGYATVWPHGEPMPTTSSVNVSDAGETAANAAVVPVGPGGMLDLSTFEAAQLVVDLTGYWIPAGSTIDGRYHSVDAPTRLVDTREGTGGKPGGAFAAGEQFDVQVTGGAVPTNATAAVVTLTYTSPTAAGFLTLWPAGGARPTVSTTNPNGPGDIRSNFAIVKLGAGGKVSLFSYAPSDVVVDVVGYFADDASGHGLFTPMSPHRVEDSRAAGQPFGRIGDGQTATLPFDGLVPAQASTVIYNLTATQTAAAGFLTAYASGQSRPLASSVNWSGRNQNRATFNGSALGQGRAVDNYAFSGTDVIVDLAGWFS
jgi:uncharacterized repeat protein (TIGR01451 family)